MIKIITPLYNAEQYVGKCIDSIKSQTYKDWECIIMDDNSSDGSNKIINDSIMNDSRFKLITNDSNVGALNNIFTGVKNYCNGDDIVFILDGDDWFSDNGVVQYINDVYAVGDTWLTYGQFQPASETYSNYCRPLYFDTSEYRSLMLGNLSMWSTSHLRTFKAFLFNNIKEYDLKDENGEFYRISYDIAIMFPMIEMCGNARMKFIDRVCYIYNDLNPINDMKVNPSFQIVTTKKILSKPKYNKL